MKNRNKKIIVDLDNDSLGLIIKNLLVWTFSWCKPYNLLYIFQIINTTN
jgi:hypothetical protein